MLFTDPLYQPFPKLIALGRRIAAEPSGTGFYSFFKEGTDRPVRKEAWWVSLTMHGMTWRLVSIHPASVEGDDPSYPLLSSFFSTIKENKSIRWLISIIMSKLLAFFEMSQRTDIWQKAP